MPTTGNFNKQRTLRLRSLACFTAISLLVTAPARGEEAQSKGAIRIGAVLSLTGPAKLRGEQARRGIQLATNEINNTGGIGGARLEIVTEDSGSNEAGARAALQKLSAVDKVSAVVGDVSPESSAALAAAAEKNQILLVTPSLCDRELPEKSEYVFSAAPRMESLRPAVELFFDLHPAQKRFAIIPSSDGAGRIYLDVWRDVLKARSLELVDTVTVSDPSTDFRAELTRLTPKKPGGLLVSFGIERTMRELRFEAVVLTTNDMLEAIYQRKFHLQDAEGIFFTDWVPGSMFRNAFENEFGSHPIGDPQQIYEAVRTVAFALRKEPTNPRAAIGAIHYPGTGGRIDFSGTHAGNFATSTLRLVRENEIVDASPYSQ